MTTQTTYLGGKSKKAWSRKLYGRGDGKIAQPLKPWPKKLKYETEYSIRRGCGNEAGNTRNTKTNLIN